jgi:phage terminase large subunit
MHHVRQAQPKTKPRQTKVKFSTAIVYRVKSYKKYNVINRSPPNHSRSAYSKLDKKITKFAHDPSKLKSILEETWKNLTEFERHAVLHCAFLELDNEVVLETLCDLCSDRELCHLPLGFHTEMIEANPQAYQNYLAWRYPEIL